MPDSSLRDMFFIAEYVASFLYRPEKARGGGIECDCECDGHPYLVSCAFYNIPLPIIRGILLFTSTLYSGLLGLIKDFVLSVWEERKVRLYGEHANVHQSHSQNDSGDLRGVAGGDGELGCLCGKAGTSHLCDGSAHSSGCVVNGSNAMAAV